VIGQDLEAGDDGVLRIARKVAKGRIISTVDPDTRHGHKTAARGFDGYKGHVAVDPDSEIITDTAVTPGNAGDASVADDLIDDLLDGDGDGGGGAKVYGDSAYGTGVLPELGAVQLNKLDKAMLRAWMARLTASHLKPASVHQVYRALRRVLEAAEENDILVRNPLDGIKPPRFEQQEMRFLAPGEVAQLEAAIDVRYRAFVTVGAYCGLRLGEMAGLRHTGSISFIATCKWSNSSGGAKTAGEVFSRRRHGPVAVPSPSRR